MKVYSRKHRGGSQRRESDRHQKSEKRKERKKSYSINKDI